MNRSKITKIGILVVASISLLIWGISYLKGKDIFHKEDVYFIIYSDVNGLGVSNPVLINGYKVGQVMDIEYIQDTVSKFRVAILVNNKYKIKAGAVAQVYSMDIMGTRGIRILMSKSDTLLLGKKSMLLSYLNLNEFHQSSDTIRSDIEGGLVEQVNMEIAPLKRKAESLISSLDSAIVIIRGIFNEKTQENLRNTFASIKTTIQNLERSTFTIDTLLTTEKSKLAKIFSNVEAITSNLKDNNVKITAIINNFANISDSLAKADIASTLKKADKALLQFNETLDAINNGDGTIAQLLNNDTLYQNIENASYHLSRLMRDLHENPKRYLHFSVFDIGKTVYQSEKEDKETKKKKKEETDIKEEDVNQSIDTNKVENK
jgi:phospholipid/cholesterol/gamma-HCH transport system substrate-binding protein